MEWICGVASSTKAAAWVQAGANIAAVAIAGWIYYASQREQQRAAKMRRDVTIAMFKDHLERALRQMEQAYNLYADAEYHPGYETGFSRKPSWLVVPSFDRLMELQGMLITMGNPLDIEIVKFIEACRSYESRLDEVVAAIGAQVPLVERERAAKAFGFEAARMLKFVEAARVALSKSNA